jgi:hypothetical protein
VWQRIAVTAMTILSILLPPLAKIELDKTASSCSNSYHVGETVSLLYDPANPQQAQMKTFSDLWLTPAGIVALGLVFTVFPKKKALPCYCNMRAICGSGYMDGARPYSGKHCSWDTLSSFLWPGIASVTVPPPGTCAASCNKRRRREHDQIRWSFCKMGRDRIYKREQIWIHFLCLYIHLSRK